MNNIFKIILLFSFFTVVTLFAIQDTPKYSQKYQKLSLENGYNAVVTYSQPLVNGKNKLSIKILKDDTLVKNADVNIIFQLPEIPNTEFIEHAVEEGNNYKLSAHFKSKGEWKYELMFKTHYGSIYSKEGKFIIN